MAPQKKRTRNSKQGAENQPVSRPAFPLKIDHARIFALADEGELPSAPPQPSAPEVEDPIRALWEEIRRMQDVAPPVPPSPPAGEVFTQLIRQEIVAVLPGIIREAIGQSLPQAFSPAGTSSVEQTQAWIVEALNASSLGLSAAEAPDYLNDNRKLADKLLLEAAKTGRLFGVTAREFFELLADEVHDFVFRVASPPAPTTAKSGSESTQAPQDTRRNWSLENAEGQRLEIRVQEFVPTPWLAARHPRELAEFGAVFERLERMSKKVAAYYRLRTFAGRSDEEIAVLTAESRETVTERLDDFVKLLQDDIETADRVQD